MTELEQMQKTQFEILKEIDKLCKEKGIVYFLAFGTCLGAIRHQGFIPWDDDIDICMDMKNYHRFCNVAGELPPYLFFQTTKSDPEYGLAIGRVRNSNTTLIEAEETNRDINHGVFVDVYPFYYSPNNLLKHKIEHYWMLLYRLFLYNEPPKHKGKAVTAISKAVIRYTPRLLKNRFITKMERIINSEKDTGYVTSVCENHPESRYESQWFSEAKQCIFNGEEFPIPWMANEYLTTRYGNYMELPPVEEQVIHHSFAYLDFDHSYKDFKGRYYCVDK